MLVLARRAGEIVQIGDGAVIVLEVREGQVKLGFQFPEATRIFRSELIEMSPSARACRDAWKKKHHDPLSSPEDVETSPQS